MTITTSLMNADDGLGPVERYRQRREDSRLEVALANASRQALSVEYAAGLEHERRMREVARRGQLGLTGVSVATKVYYAAAEAAAGDEGMAAYLLPIVLAVRDDVTGICRG